MSVPSLALTAPPVGQAVVPLFSIPQARASAFADYGLDQLGALAGDSARSWPSLVRE